MNRADDEWMAWLTEATSIVSAWERSRTGPMLRVADAAVLTDRIARQLAGAYQRGQQD